ncbi:hypothetical protein [Zavarzinia sp.]|uniref:hypothetical protein n=1 Tax=Zavarzinia sp. TaxID=2027920 RepID=UPI003563A358
MFSHTGRFYRIVGRAIGAGERCELGCTWRGRAPHNVLVCAERSGLLVLPLRRLRKVSSFPAKAGIQKNQKTRRRGNDSDA